VAIRDGQQYIDSLRDGREVWVGADRAEDVPEHPAFQSVVKTVAGIFDAQQSEENASLLTRTSPSSGEPIGAAFVAPTTPDELAERRRMVEYYARMTGGMLGRLPEYGAAFSLGLLELASDFGETDSSGGIAQWFEQVREGDLAVATSFVDPQVDRSKPARENGLLHVVSSNDDGVVIRGCKSVATGGPLNNEILILTAPRQFDSSDEVLYLSIPANSEGLRFFCREPIGEGRSLFDRPLSSRFDEPDAWMLFDDVFVPSQRFFQTGGSDFAKVAGIFKQVLNWPWYHNLIRIAVKAELLAGVATLLTEHLQTWKHVQVQEAVSETIEFAATVRSFLLAAEQEYIESPFGIRPNPATLSVAKLYAVRRYPRMLEIIRELAGQGILMAPSEAVLQDSTLGPTLERYFGAYDVPVDERVRVFHLAWDLACDAYSGRQTLFELFNAGGVTPSRLGVANGIDKAPYVELAKRVAGIIQTPEPVPTR
jgi:4-hydroxyphenylacetate 3-monooxygenase